jgi:hypothetical protein
VELSGRTGIDIPKKGVRIFYKGRRTTVSAFGSAEYHIATRFLSEPPWNKQQNSPKYEETLHRPLSYFHRQMCSDPRDKIFGLLGMIEPSRRIAVDYSQPPHAIFWQAMDSFLILGRPNLGDPKNRRPIARGRWWIQRVARDMGVTGREEIQIGETARQNIIDIFGKERKLEEIFKLEK